MEGHMAEISGLMEKALWMKEIRVKLRLLKPKLSK